MKKSKIKYVFIIVFILGILSQCKKGENDPFISLRTRKARVAGDWTATSGTSFLHIESPGYSSTSNTIYKNNSFSQESTITYSNVTTTYNFTGKFIYKIKFDKNGDFVMSTTFDNGYNIYMGNWNFTGAVGELKNKEQIVLNVTSEDHSGSMATHNGNNTRYTFNIRELRNKKMVLYNQDSSIDNGNVSETKEEYTFEQ